MIFMITMKAKKMYKNKNKNTRDKAKATQPANAKRTVYYEELDELQLERCAAGKAAKATGPSGQEPTGSSNGKVPSGEAPEQQKQQKEFWQKIDPKTGKEFRTIQEYYNHRNNEEMMWDMSWYIPTVRQIFSSIKS